MASHSDTIILIDVIIPLGSGSKWQNNELRYTLRSVQKNLTGVRYVIVVGQLPDWCRNVVQINFADNPMWRKDRNIAAKAFNVTGIESITSRFLFMSDDHYLLQQFNAEAFPVYHQGELIKEIMHRRDYDNYRRMLLRTQAELELRGLSTLNYNMHIPMLMDKVKLRKVIMSVDWEDGVPFALKTLYGNVMQLGGEEIKDVKVRDQMKYEALRKYVDGKMFFSSGDVSLNGDMRRLIEELFPEKSKYEA